MAPITQTSPQTPAASEDVACPLCASQAQAPARRDVLCEDPWRLVRCDGCDLVFLTPRPSPGDMHGSFEWFEHGSAQMCIRRTRQGPARRLARRCRGLLRRRREDVVLDRIRRFVSSGRFLDIGCGDAAMVRWMAEHGYDAHGIDVSSPAVEAAVRAGIQNIRHGTIHDADFADASFDAVLLMSVLEHEHRPVDALREVARVLRPGGYAFIKVPNYGCWNRRVLGSGWSGYFFPQHLYYFTPHTLERAAHAAGLVTARNRWLDHVPVSDVMWFTARRPLTDANGTK